MDAQKFIMCYIANEYSNDFLKDSISNEGIERGLIFKNKINKEIINSFTLMKERGYFPVGIIIDPITDNAEFLFKRHPQQKLEQKLAELKETQSLNL